MNQPELVLQRPIVTVDSPAPSPFLPGTKIQYALDSTSLGYFKTCPRLYYYTIILGWQPKGESVHLLFGRLYHEALHLYDIHRLEHYSHDDAVYQVVLWLCANREGYPDVSEEKPSIRAKSFEALLRTTIWYLDRYPTEKDPAKTLTLENGKPACELSFRFELDWGPTRTKLIGKQFWDSDNQEVVIEPTEVTETIQPYILCGHLDRVVEFAGHPFVMDRKTTSAVGPKYFDQWAPHNQMSLYTIAGQIVLGAPVRGVIIDAAEVKEETRNHPAYSEFFRGFTYRTKEQNEEWLADLHYWTAQMETSATLDEWPMNDLSCDKYGGCKFREVCSKSPSVRESFLKSQFERAEPWNPLKVR